MSAFRIDAIASETWEGGGRRSHLRRKRFVIWFFCRGRAAEINEGMEGFDCRPSWVAVSKYKGWRVVVVVVEVVESVNTNEVVLTTIVKSDTRFFTISSSFDVDASFVAIESLAPTRFLFISLKIASGVGFREDILKIVCLEQPSTDSILKKSGNVVFASLMYLGV
tara:strand:- start:66 stop:563 length:498 start_codon:yes stop_codon:yes gene_type:complete